jgi:hypothetical protein
MSPIAVSIRPRVKEPIGNRIKRQHLGTPKCSKNVATIYATGSSTATNGSATG